MEPLSFLGTYLVMALLLPGLVVLSVAAVLFPELRALLAAAATAEQIAAVCLASFLSGHIPYFVERYLLTTVWDRMYRSYRLKERSAIMAERGVLVVGFDLAGLSRRHYDAALGSFIFYYNTSFWCVILSAVAVALGPDGSLLGLAIGIGIISLVALFFTAPLYKKSLIGILEVMKNELEARNSLPPTAPSGGGKDAASTLSGVSMAGTGTPAAVQKTGPASLRKK